MPWPARAQDAKRASNGSEPVYALVTTSAKHVRGDLTFEFVAPKIRAKEEDSGQGVQGARRSDGPGGVRGEPPSAAARPTPARDQGCTPRRSTPTKRVTACARGRSSVRLPVPILLRLARCPQAPARAEGGGDRLCPPSFPRNQERVSVGPGCRDGSAGLARL